MNPETQPVATSAADAMAECEQGNSDVSFVLAPSAAAPAPCPEPSVSRLEAAASLLEMEADTKFATNDQAQAGPKAAADVALNDAKAEAPTKGANADGDSKPACDSAKAAAATKKESHAAQETRKMRNREAQRRRRQRIMLIQGLDVVNPKVDKAEAMEKVAAIDPSLALRRRKLSDFETEEARTDWRRMQNREAKRRYRQKSRSGQNSACSSAPGSRSQSFDMLGSDCFRSAASSMDSIAPDASQATVINPGSAPYSLSFLQTMYHHQNGQPFMVLQMPPAGLVEGNNNNNNNNNNNSNIDIPSPFGVARGSAQAYNQANHVGMMSSTSMPQHVSSSVVGNINNNNNGMQPPRATSHQAASSNQYQGFSVDRQLKLLMETSSLRGNNQAQQQQQAQQPQQGASSSQGFEGFASEGRINTEQQTHLQQHASNVLALGLQNVRGLADDRLNARHAYEQQQQQQQARGIGQVLRHPYSQSFDMGQQQQQQQQQKRLNVFDPMSQSFDMQQQQQQQHDCHMSFDHGRVQQQQQQQDAIPERSELINLSQQDDDVNTRSIHAALFPGGNNAVYNKWQGFVQPPADRIGCWTSDPLLPGGMASFGFAAQHQGDGVGVGNGSNQNMPGGDMFNKQHQHQQ